MQFNHINLIAKGIKTKRDILIQARDLYNQEGLGITLAELAKRMNTTLGRITYHFPTKDHLFIALAQLYEEKQMISRSKSLTGEYGLDKFIYRSMEGMDIQYEYRCVIRYFAASIKTHNAVFEHLSTQFSSNNKLMLDVFSSLVKHGSLSERLLQPDVFPVFLFKFVNLFTTWVISLEIYDSDKSYAEMKPIYLRGIFSSFVPFLTEKGNSEIQKTGLQLS